MERSKHYAHTLPPPHCREEWEPLWEHLRRVAEGAPGTPGAAAFAAAFGAEEWGRLLGWWHDVGKYSKEFQEYLVSSRASGDGNRAACRGRVDHSTAGAQLAMRRGSLGKLLAYAIAGHHAGLPDGAGSQSSLRDRMNKDIPAYDDAPRDILDRPLPAPPAQLKPSATPQRTAFSVGFFIRMLFSCLVDADFLATEAFMNPDKASLRPLDTAPLGDLLERLNAYLEVKIRDSADTEVNRRRREVLAACRGKATLPPGFYSLNVPTGGGKTLSSLAFGLEHAIAHDLRRVVYAIPYTSIIEQTADVFRKALADLAKEMLEHHSAVDRDNPELSGPARRLAAENFHAPLVVTTNVQLFESLFATRTSRCRKLHRLARSVIILDEAQTLPPNLLAPSLAALSEMVQHYGSTVVLCTATQPAIECRDGFPIGLTGVTPIIEEPEAFHESFRRARITSVGRLEDVELAEQLSAQRSVLCIVNSRRHARDLFSLLDDPEAFHLSASMCAVHRSEVLAEVRRHLEDNDPCRLVATQVVEAGVDIDFPVVYRAAAGLDSIAQAAGRCNREGRLPGAGGQVVVFEYEEEAHPSPPFIKRAAGHYREIAAAHSADLFAPDAVSSYFRLHYWQQGGDDGSGWDRGRGKLSVMRCFGGEDGDPGHHQFREGAERYRLIDDAQTNIVVPYGQRGSSLIKWLVRMTNSTNPSELRQWDRKAQRYLVGVHERTLGRLIEASVVVEHLGRHYLANREAYDSRVGLTLDAAGMDPVSLIW